MTKWIPCPANDGGYDCTPFCPTCKGVQFVEHRHGFAFTGTHADCDCGYTFKQAIDELNGVRNG